MSLINRLLPLIIQDPVNLGHKAKLLGALACLVSIWMIAALSHSLNLGPAYPLMVASMGASAVMVFFCHIVRWRSPGPWWADICCRRRLASPASSTCPIA